MATIIKENRRVCVYTAKFLVQEKTTRLTSIIQFGEHVLFTRVSTCLEERDIYITLCCHNAIKLAEMKLEEWNQIGIPFVMYAVM